MIDALLVRAVNSFETIGVFTVLLSTRGCCNQEDQCVFQREYGCMASSMIESARWPVSRTSSCVEYHARPVRSASASKSQLGAKRQIPKGSSTSHARYCAP